MSAAKIKAEKNREVSMAEKTSIIIGTYNTEEYIARCVLSVLN